MTNANVQYSFISFALSQIATLLARLSWLQSALASQRRGSKAKTITIENEMIRNVRMGRIDKIDNSNSILIFERRSLVAKSEAHDWLRPAPAPAPGRHGALSGNYTFDGRVAS